MCHPESDSLGITLVMPLPSGTDGLYKEIALKFKKKKPNEICYY
jgi:hypothetical protein